MYYSYTSYVQYYMNLFIVSSENQAEKYIIITNTLLIKGFKKEDEGSYQCTVRDGDNQWTSEQFYLEYKGIYH